MKYPTEYPAIVKISIANDSNGISVLAGFRYTSKKEIDEDLEELNSKQLNSLLKEKGQNKLTLFAGVVITCVDNGMVLDNEQWSLLSKLLLLLFDEPQVIMVKGKLIEIEWEWTNVFRFSKISKEEYPNTMCNSCKKDGKRTEMKLCGGCKTVHYCNKECQLTAWKNHKKTCNHK